MEPWFLTLDSNNAGSKLNTFQAVTSIMKNAGMFDHKRRHSRSGSAVSIISHQNKYKAKRRALATKCVMAAIVFMVMWKAIGVAFVGSAGNKTRRHAFIPSVMVTSAISTSDKSDLDVTEAAPNFGNYLASTAIPEFEDGEENNETLSGDVDPDDREEDETRVKDVSPAPVSASSTILAASDDEEECKVDAGLEEAKEEFFNKVHHKKIFTQKQLLCKLKELKPRFVTSHSPFLANWTKWKHQVPAQSLSGFFNTCAVVSNSGGMLDSGMGYAIDNHDLIMRFNDGPATPHSSDVGSKNATWRLINGQLPLRWGNHSKNLMESFLLAENSTLIFWHHCCCSISNMQDCLELEPNSTGMVRKIPKAGDDSPDGFRAYFQLIEEYFDTNIHLLDFQYVFEIWQFLKVAYGRALAPERPPSSGFLGIMMLMHHCNHVDAYEFVPSKIRHPPEIPVRCHYYNPNHHLMNVTANHTCDIYGSERWHPLYAEKSVLYQLNTAEDEQVFRRGVIRIPGLNQIDCGS